MYFDCMKSNIECCCNCIPKPVESVLSCRPELEDPIKNLTLRDFVRKVAEMDSKEGKLQSNFVIEEFAELIIEMARTYRPDKTNKKKIFDEACDVLATTFVVLYSLGVDEDVVRERIKSKYRLTLDKGGE